MPAYYVHQLLLQEALKQTWWFIMTVGGICSLAKDWCFGLLFAWLRGGSSLTSSCIVTSRCIHCHITLYSRARHLDKTEYATFTRAKEQWDYAREVHCVFWSGYRYCLQFHSSSADSLPSTTSVDHHFFTFHYSSCPCGTHICRSATYDQPRCVYDVSNATVGKWPMSLADKVWCWLPGTLSCMLGGPPPLAALQLDSPPLLPTIPQASPQFSSTNN